MTDLSDDQSARRAEIHRKATIFGAIVGGLVALIALWLLGSLGAGLRWGGALIAGGAAGFAVYRANFNAGAASAKCAACGAAFSRTRTDRTEMLTASEPREERKDLEDGRIEVTTWTEEVYDVTETYTCANCGDVTAKTYKTNRRKDEEVRVELPEGRKTKDPAAAPASAPSHETLDHEAGTAQGAPTDGRKRR